MRKLTVKFSMIIAIWTGLFIIGCANIKQDSKSDEITIVIAETTDTHGAIFPYDFASNEETDYSQAQVYSYVKELRKEHGENLILISGGDTLQGSPMVYYYNFIETNSPHIVAEVMNFMDYKAGAVGNHDIEAGHAVYDKLTNEFNFPWMAANAVENATGEPYFEPYTVIEREGIKIAIFGLITPGIPGWLPETIWEGITFEDMVETAQEWVPYILSNENPDLLIGLFHSGLDYTYGGGNYEEPQNENASLIVAEQVPGFDAIFIGHDHDEYCFYATNSNGDDVLIVDSNNRGRALGVVYFTMNRNRDSITNFEYTYSQIVDTTEYEPDPEMMEKFADQIEAVKEFVSKEIGTFTETISIRDAMYGDSAFMGLIHSLQLEISGADISFAAPLQFDTEIEAGPVTVGDMFNLYKYENLLYTMSLTGQEIKDYLEYSYGNWFNTNMTGPDDHLMNFKRDETGELTWSERYESYELTTRYYNYSSAGGLDYVIDLTKPVGERVVISGLSDGREFNSDETYLVAVNSYRGNGGGDHLTEGAGIPEEELSDRVVTSTTRDLRYYIIDWISTEGTVNPAALGNWEVIPTDWWESAKETDYEIMY